MKLHFKGHFTQGYLVNTRHGHSASFIYLNLVCAQYGLYSAFMGGFIYMLLGTSKDVTLGPTAIMSLLCFSVVGGQPHRAVLLSLLCGLVQAVMALLRLGEDRAWYT